MYTASHVSQTLLTNLILFLTASETAMGPGERVVASAGEAPFEVPAVPELIRNGAMAAAALSSLDISVHFAKSRNSVKW